MLEVTARAAADLLGHQGKTATLVYRKILVIIAEKLEVAASEVAGEIVLDESFFRVVRKGKRGRVAGGKVSVFGILSWLPNIFYPPTEA